MNTEQFSGFNPMKAKIDLAKFHQEVTQLYNIGKSAFEEYNAKMITAWHSPIAKQYSGIIVGRAAVLGYYIAYLDDQVLKPAINAVKNMAHANHTSFDYDYTPLMDEYLSDELHEADDLGNVGMDLQGVKDAFEEFKSVVHNIVDSIGSLPKDLALYDPSGVLAANYQQLIMIVQRKVIEEISNVSNAIELLIVQEQTKITSSVNAASQTLAE